MGNFCKIILAMFVFCALTSVLSACGRYSEPSPIEGSNFPHTYPQH
ncbi:MAG: hypothetical protein IJ525_07690 [Alphaproteobacteria bacterium]|nr:hypothetical protein [Alphaproteobacteria bacterium]